MVFFQFQEISATLKKFVLIILEIKSNLVKSNPHPHLLPPPHISRVQPLQFSDLIMASGCCDNS